ncbi:hypothetical protein D3C75_943900 [compost metagenome]
MAAAVLGGCPALRPSVAVAVRPARNRVSHRTAAFPFVGLPDHVLDPLGFRIERTAPRAKIRRILVQALIVPDFPLLGGTAGAVLLPIVLLASGSPPVLRTLLLLHHLVFLLEQRNHSVGLASVPGIIRSVIPLVLIPVKPVCDSCFIHPYLSLSNSSIVYFMIEMEELEHGNRWFWG